MSLRPKGLGRGEHIVFGADPVGNCGRVGVRVGIREASFPRNVQNRVSVHYLLNQLIDFNQTCTDTLLRKEKEVIRIW